MVSGNVFTRAGQVRIAAHDGIYTLLVNLDANTATAELTIDVHSATALVAGDLVL